MNSSMSIHGALKHTYHAAYHVQHGYAYMVAKLDGKTALWVIPLKDQTLSLVHGYPVFHMEDATYYCDKYLTDRELRTDLALSFNVVHDDGWLPYDQNPLA